MTKRPSVQEASLTEANIARTERSEIGTSLDSIDAIAPGLRVPASFLTVMSSPPLKMGDPNWMLLASFQNPVYAILDEEGERVVKSRRGRGR